jgi:hypothetical protein
MTVPPDIGEEQPSKARGILVAGGQLAALWSLAVAQPLFDLFSRSPEFFAARGSPPGDIVLFALGVTLAPPAVLLAIEILAGIVRPGLRPALHLVFVAALVALGVLYLGNRVFTASGTWILFVSAALGVLAALVYAKVAAARAFLTVLSPVPLVFIALFLLASPVTRLVFREETKAPSAVAIQSTTPVVLIIFDELPTVALMNEAQEIDSVRFPAFARLARESTWFRNATTVHAHTHRAVPAILTGRVPEEDALPLLVDHPNNLFTLLGSHYDLRALETLTRLCPADRCRAAAPDPTGTRLKSLGLDLGVVYLHMVVPASLRSRLPSVSENWSNFLGQDDDTDEESGSRAGAEGARQAREIVRTCARKICTFAGLITRPRKPTLFFLHSLLPHVPWYYLPSGRRYAGAARTVPGQHNGRLGENEWIATQAYQRFLLQLGYTDRALGVLLDRLRAEKIYDAALVVVTADHGASFRPGEPRRNATRANLADLAFVPLFVKEPGRLGGRVVDSPARTVDLLPTIAEVLGIQIPWAVDGRSLLGVVRPVAGDVTIPGQEGVPITRSLRSLLAERRLALDEQVRLFGTGEWDDVYAVGADTSLYGADVAELAVVEGSGTVELNGRASLASVRRNSVVSASYLAGRVPGGSPPGQTLAVAVNGKIAAITQTYVDGGDVVFSAMVPEEVIRAGANDVEIFVVRMDSTAPTLERLRMGRR